MTESKAETAPKPAKELLALNPKQESEFKKKVQEAKKNKSSKVGREESVALKETCTHFTRGRCCFINIIFWPKVPGVGFYSVTRPDSVTLISS